MKLRHLKIRNFRGIRKLDWTISADTVCLIGAGDSGKTTILDAITYALSPRWSLPLNDADFFGGVPNAPIKVRVTVSDPPPELIREDRFGMFLRGWSPDGELHDDPTDTDERALTVQFTADRSLEPQWLVVKDAEPEGKIIRSSARAKLKVFRVDERSDYHLGWGRGSALAALTADLDELPKTLAEAHREARRAFGDCAPGELRVAAENAHSAAEKLGVSSSEVFAPAIDPSALSQRGALVLSSGAIPATSLGLGSRRLAALGVQAAQVATGSIVVVDEVEHALEPHRLRHLLDRLCQAVKGAAESAEDQEDEGVSFGQVFLSTHSPITIEELNVEAIHVVRQANGETAILRVLEVFKEDGETDPQALVRGGAEALLGRRIVVCEGKTEVGFFRALSRHWAHNRGKPAAQVGTVPLDGEGDPYAHQRALGLSKLHYTTALLMDSDKVQASDLEHLTKHGVVLVQWSDRTSIEERIALDLPESGFEQLVKLATDAIGEEQAEQAIPQLMANHFEVAPATFDGLNPKRWLEESGLEPHDIRRAFGQTANKKKWFKSIEGGETLGGLVLRYLGEMTDTDTSEKIRALERFTYGE